MKKNHLIALAIIAGTILIGYFFYLNYNRYYIMTTSKGIAYELDKKTGKTWMLSGGKRILHKDPSSKEKRLSSLPKEELINLAGRGSLSSSAFSGSLYNGSHWVIKEVTFDITVKEVDDSVRWNRQYKDDVHIEPKTSGSVYLSITGGHKFGSFAWNIVEAKGYKE